MKLSEDLKKCRIDRPDEWTMDRFIEKAETLETRCSESKVRHALRDWLTCADTPSEWMRCRDQAKRALNEQECLCLGPKGFDEDPMFQKGGLKNDLT
jgi:hypothetical protein